MTTTVAPANVTYGTVIGRFLEMVEDSTDPDVQVDAVGKSDGTVTFVADVQYMLDLTSTPPATIIPTPIYASTDVDGYLVDDQGNPGVTLVATDGPTNPTDFTYQVTLAFPGVPARTFSIKVPGGTTVDLTTVSPMTVSTGRSESQGPKGDVGPIGPVGPAGVAGPNGDRDRLLGLTAAVDTDCFLYRLDRTPGTAYWLGQHIGEGRYWSSELWLHSPTPGGMSIHGLRYASIFYATLSKPWGDASIVYTGSGWVTSGTQRRQTETAGDSFTFTSPTGITRIGIAYTGFNNGGLSKVEIDGDPTRATILPTAQDLVTTGVAANTILVANGGYFQPTDRVFDTYLQPSDTGASIMLASDLVAGAHTVKVTYSGKARIAAVLPARLYVAGMLHATGSERVATPSMVLCAGDRILSNGSVWEYAMSMTPTGAPNNVFVGNGHGYDNETALTFTVDGVAKTPANKEVIPGTLIAVHRVSELFHPDTGATKFADIVVDYTVDGQGLYTDHSVTWRQSGAAGGSVYPAMFPLNKNLFDWGANPFYLIDAHLIDADQSTKANVPSDTLALWSSANNYVATMHLIDQTEAVNDYKDIHGNLTAFIQDRDDNVLNKAYFTKYDSPGGSNVVPGTVWRSRVRRQVNRLPANAHLTAARKPPFGTAASVNVKDIAGSGGVNVKDFGAKGDGTNETAAIQAAIDATPIGGTLEFSGSTQFRVDGQLNVSKAITIQSISKGGVYSQAGTTAQKMWNVTASGVHFRGLKMVGPQFATSSEQYAIYATGGSGPTSLTDFSVDDCDIRGFGKYGVYGLYLTDFRINDNAIRDCGYTGIGVHSGVNGTIDGNLVKNITQATGYTNSYGIYTSRQDSDDFTANPRSQGVSISGNRVSDVPLWDGINTHGGKGHVIADNVVTNCDKAIEIVASDSAAGNPDYAPLDIKVIGNDIDSWVTDGSRKSGILFVGAQGAANTPGSTPEYGTGIISGNTVRGHGRAGITTDGAIKFYYTKGLIVTGNTIIEPVPHGVMIYHTNVGFTCTGNVVIDPWNTSGIAAGVSCNAGNNTGVIDGNVVQRGAKTAAVVLTHGAYLQNNTNSKVTIGLTNSFDAAATPWFDNVRLSDPPLLLKPDLLANRPAASSALLFKEFLATDVGGGTRYACVNNGGGTFAWVQTGAGVTGTVPRVDSYTTPGTFTWTKPAGAVRVEVVAISGGSGGGSGRRGAAASVRTGGGAGAGGTRSTSSFMAADLGATESVFVGAGGAGGATVAVDSTSGADGLVGVSSYFGASNTRWVSAPAPSGGTGGSAAATAGGLAGAPGGSIGAAASSTGSSGATANNGTGRGTSLTAGAGGSGSGITTGDAPNAGGSAGPGGAGPGSAAAGGTLGGGVGAVGFAANTNSRMTGGGGGGGGSSINSAAGAGGNGGSPGGGGGGGGASLNGFNSGAGGNGADGAVYVITYFN